MEELLATAIIGSDLLRAVTFHVNVALLDSTVWRCHLASFGSTISFPATEFQMTAWFPYRVSFLHTAHRKPGFHDTQADRATGYKVEFVLDMSHGT